MGSASSTLFSRSRVRDLQGSQRQRRLVAWNQYPGASAGSTTAREDRRGAARLIIATDNILAGQSSFIVDERGAWLLSNGHIVAKSAESDRAPSGSLGSIVFGTSGTATFRGDQELEPRSSQRGEPSPAATASNPPLDAQLRGYFTLHGLPPRHPLPFVCSWDENETTGPVGANASGDDLARHMQYWQPDTVVWAELMGERIVTKGFIFRAGSADLCCTHVRCGNVDTGVQPALTLQLLKCERDKSNRNASDEAGLGPAIKAGTAAETSGDFLSQRCISHLFEIGADGGVIGRRRDCAVCLGADISSGVSARHALLTWNPHSNHFVLRDLGSTNGTFERVEDSVDNMPDAAKENGGGELRPASSATLADGAATPSASNDAHAPVTSPSTSNEAHKIYEAGCRDKSCDSHGAPLSVAMKGVIALQPDQQIIVGSHQFRVLQHDFGVSTRRGGRHSVEDRYRVIQDLRAGPAKWPLSYFAVFDGHGGQSVSAQLQANLHKHVACALKAALNGENASNRSDTDTKVENNTPAKTCLWPVVEARPSSSKSSMQLVQTDSVHEAGDAFDDAVRDALTRAFAAADKQIYAAHLRESTIAAQSIPHTKEAASDGPAMLAKPAMERGDGSIRADTVGSTAVVQLVVGQRLYCAHVGDSRAVLCRNGVAVELSSDHRPTRQDELERILAASGVVWQGRVLGQLAVSRAFGDFGFKYFNSGTTSGVTTPASVHANKQAEAGSSKVLGAAPTQVAAPATVVTASTQEPQPIVSCVPEVRAVMLQQVDQFVVLGCDGLFDVMSSQAVVDFVRLHKMYPDCIQQVAEALTLHAIREKGSEDNTTCLIVLLHCQAAQCKPT